MKLLICCLLAVTGCTTSNTPLTAEQRQQRDLDHRAVDERRHADDLNRHAQDEQRHAQEDLQRRFERYTTAELRMMHTHYSELTGHAGTRDLTVNPLATKIWGTSDAANTEKLIEVDRELLRRYTAGDTSAKLDNL